jgi:hypothetical protein
MRYKQKQTKKKVAERDEQIRQKPRKRLAYIMK